MGNGVTLSVLSKDNPSSTAVKLKANQEETENDNSINSVKF